MAHELVVETQADEMFDLAIGEIESEIPEQQATAMVTWYAATCSRIYCC